MTTAKPIYTTQEAVGDNGELLGFEIYDGDKLIDFITYRPLDEAFYSPAGLARGKLAESSYLPSLNEKKPPEDTCCGCGGCFDEGDR